MRASFRDLAAGIDDNLPGPILIVGLAEMGICLGQGVHEEYRSRTGRQDVAYIHSTRHLVDRPLMTTFEEAHSHAPFHALYWPQSPEVRAAVQNARSLILVDDEASTGTTFANLAKALLSVLPKIERVVTLVLTDWSGEGYLDRIDRPAVAVSLLAGRLNWTPDGAQPICKQAPLPAETHHGLPNFGRLGRLDVANEADSRADSLHLRKGRPVRLIGTSEFTYAPFRIAERLERSGYSIDVQATSRSPARIGGDIQSSLQFRDNYGEGVRHFLYNQAGGSPRQTVICAETPAGSIDDELVVALGARVLNLSEVRCAQSY